MQQRRKGPDRRQEENGLDLSGAVKAIIDKIKSIRLDVSFIIPLTFSLLLIFKLIDLAILNKTVENALVIPFQLIIFLVPAYLFARFKNEKAPLDYLFSLRVRAPRPYQIPLLISSLGLSIFGTMLLSTVVAGQESLESGFTLYNTFVSRTGGGFFSNLFLMLAYCAVPAFCEELVFRGILCREYERHSPVAAIASASIFFAMLHFDPGQFPVYLFSGVVLAMVMYATGSLVASMTVHFAFNLFGLFGQPYLSAFYNVTGGSSGLFLFIITMLTLLFAALFCLAASKCYAVRAKYSKMPKRPVFPHYSRLTHILSEIFINPFVIFSLVLYIVVAVVIPLVI